MEEKKKKLGVTNVEPLLGTVKDTKLPVDSVDAVLLVDAYHEFDHPYEMARSIHKSLRPETGRLFLIEYRLEDPEVPIKLLHKMSQKQAIKEMKAAGFAWVETLDFLPRQHVMIFKKPKLQAEADKENKEEKSGEAKAEKTLK